MRRGPTGPERTSAPDVPLKLMTIFGTRPEAITLAPVIAFTWDAAGRATAAAYGRAAGRRSV